MMECKKALSDPSVGEDLSKAMDWLRKKGIARATNQNNERIVSEGLIGVLKNEENGNISIVEVNSETDFVSRNIDFQNFVCRLLQTINKTEISSVSFNFFF